MTGRRLTIVLGTALAASLAFNLFFLGGYLSRRHEAREPERSGWSREVVAEELALDEAQRRVFGEIGARVRAKAEASQGEIAALRGQFWRELEGPRPDRARLGELLEGISRATANYHLAALDATTELLEVLRPDQRERFRRLLGSTDPLGLRPLGTEPSGPDAPRGPE